MPFVERRKTKRVNVKIPAGIYLKNKPDDCIDAEILDLSVGGAFVHCTAPINIGQEILLEIRFTESFLLEAKVVIAKEALDESTDKLLPEKVIVKWARGSAQSGFGVAFVDLKPDKKAFLQKLLSYFESLKKSGVTLPNR